MWKYTNVRFIYSNPVDSIISQEHIIPELYTYIKSKYALVDAITYYVENSYLGVYTEIDYRSIKHDKLVIKI